jgi:hypothetical protein
MLQWDLLGFFAMSALSWTTVSQGLERCSILWQLEHTIAMSVILVFCEESISLTGTIW